MTRKLYKHALNFSDLKMNNGHDCCPPDCYVYKYDIAYDVLSVTDTEEVKIGKNGRVNYKNNQKIVERNIIKHKHKRSIYYQNVTPAYIGTLEQYLANARRVIKAHINKVHIWKPYNGYIKIKYKGLYIYDNVKIYNTIINNKLSEVSLLDDNEIMTDLCHSDLDFVIFYKQNSCFSPNVSIIDLRIEREKCKIWKEQIVC